MRTVYLLAVVVIGLLLTRATSDGDDPKRASANVDFRQNKSVNKRNFRARPPAALSIIKASPTRLPNHGPAIIGGPATQLKSAPVINGTEMKRQ